jgi:hypothetical protein
MTSSSLHMQLPLTSKSLGSFLKVFKTGFRVYTCAYQQDCAQNLSDLKCLGR